MKRSERLARWLGAALGLFGGFLLGYFLVRGGTHSYPGYVIIGLTSLEGLIFAYLGTPYVLGGWRTFNFRLTSTPLPDLLSGLLGVVVGLVIASLIAIATVSHVASSLPASHFNAPADPHTGMCRGRHSVAWPRRSGAAPESAQLAR